MSIYKSEASPFYHYDFQIDSNHFHGTTKTRNKKEAEAIERQLKEQAKRDAAQLQETGDTPLTIDTAVWRYWAEKGQFRADKGEYFQILERIVSHFGKDYRLDQVDDEVITAWVAQRRKQFRWGKSKLRHAEAKTLSNASINRHTVGPLKAIFRNAKMLWGYNLPDEPHWNEHLLQEPRVRFRKLLFDEQQALNRSIREDYRQWHRFLQLSGRRLKETFIRWSDVNWEAGKITTAGKGNTPWWTPMTPSIREILESCRGHHPEFVFTFVSQGAGRGQVAGCRYPMSYSGAQTQWVRARARSGVKNFRLNDYRYNLALNLILETYNLKLVQRVLNHANIITIASYALVRDDDVALALESCANEVQGTDLG